MFSSVPTGVRLSADIDGVRGRPLVAGASISMVAGTGWDLSVTALGGSGVCFPGRHLARGDVQADEPFRMSPWQGAPNLKNVRSLWRNSGNSRMMTDSARSGSSVG